MKKELIITYEFGSTFQNLNDDYSDLDIVEVYKDNILENYFSNNKVKSKHLKNEIVQYDILKFFKIIEKGSFSSAIHLCSALQTSDSLDFMIGDFRNDEFFTHFFRKKAYVFCSSLIGETFSNKLTSGKSVFKNTVQLIRLENFLNDYEKNTLLSYKTLASQPSKEALDLLKIKRLSLEEVPKCYLDNLSLKQENLKNRLSNFNFESFKDEDFPELQKIKERIMIYLCESYLKETKE